MPTDKCEESIYSLVCKPKFKSIDGWQAKHDKEAKQRQAELVAKLDNVNKKLFLGNGNQPWDVRLDRLEQSDIQSKNRWKWLCGIAGSLCVAVSLKLVWELIAHVS